MLLRGFDRDAVAAIQEHMTAAGTEIIEGVLPKAIEKQTNGKLLVTYGDDNNTFKEEFDTVLAG